MAGIDRADPQHHGHSDSGELEHQFLVVGTADAGQLLRAVHHGEQFVFQVEIVDGQGGQHAFGQAGRRGIEFGVHPVDGDQQGVTFLGVHSWPPFSSELRSLSRQRRRVGPILPMGMPRFWARPA